MLRAAASKFDSHGCARIYFFTRRRRLTHRSAFATCLNLQTKLRAHPRYIAHALATQIGHYGRVISCGREDDLPAGAIEISRRNFRQGSLAQFILTLLLLYSAW